MVPPAGLEPARVTSPADFESALYTISARRHFREMSASRFGSAGASPAGLSIFAEGRRTGLFGDGQDALTREQVALVIESLF